MILPSVQICISNNSVFQSYYSGGAKVAKNAGQRVSMYSRSSSSSWQWGHTAFTEPLLNYCLFFCNMYVTVRIRAFTIPFLTSDTEESIVLQTRRVVQKRKFLTDKHFKVFLVLISHTWVLDQCILTCLAHSLFPMGFTDFTTYKLTQG